MYKVTYYASESSSYGEVLNKLFETADEAFEFSRKLGERVIETKQYKEMTHYPLPDLDMS